MLPINQSWIPESDDPDSDKPPFGVMEHHRNRWYSNWLTRIRGILKIPKLRMDIADEHQTSEKHDSSTNNTLSSSF